MVKKFTRAAAAFLAHNMYVALLGSVFFELTGYIFDQSQIASIIKGGAEFDQRAWGWHGHYIWMLFASLITTLICSVVSGAISKDNRGITSAIASLPTVIFWGLTLYLMLFTGPNNNGQTTTSSYFMIAMGLDYASQTGTAIVAFLGIPLTIFIAYRAGKIGAEIQKDWFQDTTVLGINGWHLIWLAYPIYLYALGAVEVTAKLFINFFNAIWVDDFAFPLRLFMGLTNFVLVIAVIAWCAPLAIVYKVLSRQIMADNSILSRSGANFVLIVGGWFVASGVQIASYWIMRTALSWF